MNRIRRVCKDVRFLSNPCRVGYFTQEICVFRRDVGDGFVRNRVDGIKGPENLEFSLDEATIAARNVPPHLLPSLFPPSKLDVGCWLIGCDSW